MMTSDRVTQFKRVMVHKHVIVKTNYQYIVLHIDLYIENMAYTVNNGHVCCITCHVCVNGMYI